jgi:hypothetical protein
MFGGTEACVLLASLLLSTSPYVCWEVCTATYSVGERWKIFFFTRRIYPAIEFPKMVSRARKNIPHAMPRCRSANLTRTVLVVASLWGSLILSSTVSNGFCFPKPSNARVWGRGGGLDALELNGDQNYSSSSPSRWNGKWQAAMVRCSSGVVAALFILYGNVVAPVQAASTEVAEIRGIKLTPLNSLTFNYRGGDFDGLDASVIKDQPTISYQDFLAKLSNGEVAYVEFLAPNGDEAYVTLKAKEGEKVSPAPIRIGEGYPIEKNDGWSSPVFVIRSLKDKSVPYKFVLPALEKYK